METHDKVRLRGHLRLVLRGPDGNVKDVREIENTVTAAGQAVAADRLLASPTLGVPTHVAVGSGTPAANALGAQIGSRYTFGSKTRSTNVVTMVRALAAGEGTGAITEAGIFDAATTGNMHLSQSFAVVNKAAGDTLDITWTWTFGT
jgi:hypothetical protein